MFLPNTASKAYTFSSYSALSRYVVKKEEFCDRLLEDAIDLPEPLDPLEIREVFENLDIFVSILLIFKFLLVTKLYFPLLDADISDY